MEWAGHIQISKAMTRLRARLKVCARSAGQSRQQSAKRSGILKALSPAHGAQQVLIPNARGKIIIVASTAFSLSDAANRTLALLSRHSLACQVIAELICWPVLAAALFLAADWLRYGI